MFLRSLHSKSLSIVVIYSHKPVVNLVRVERISLTRMLSNMPISKCFAISGHLVKSFISEKIPTWLPHALSHLTELWLHCFEFGDLNQLECALCLLRNSPNLEALSIIDIVMKPRDIHFDVEPASNHLEAPDCFDQTVHRLQTVKIIHLRGSRPELLFYKASTYSFSICYKIADCNSLHLQIIIDVKIFTGSSTSETGGVSTS